MIVDPDFFEHWRTRMVVDALGGDELAPVYIMRLWAHCQTRKSDRFKMPAPGLKAQCRYSGDAVLFEKAMSEAGFVQREGDEVVVVGWAEQNASLIAAWENGAKGGRPKKEPVENPAVTHGKPDGNPTLTQAKPIREDKSREDKKEPKSKASALATRLPPDWLPTDGDAEYCKTKRPDLLLTDVAERFRDYWVGSGGKKVDWNATWRHWVQNERRITGQGAPPKVNEKFNFGHLDRSGDRRAADETIRRHNITVPEGDEEIEI